MQTLAHEIQGRFRVIGRQIQQEVDEFADDVRSGLTASPKRLSPRYIYDRRGSLLFEKICGLDEYYLTRAEIQILERYQDEIIDTIQDCESLIELGSGSSVKTQLLLGGILERDKAPTYIPIDISRDMLAQSAAGLLRQFPSLDITALAAEYSDALDHAAVAYDGPRCVIWLGSSIGNLERADAVAFVSQIRDHLKPHDRLLIGIDLKKDAATLEAAYDDAQNVTARFNTNILRRINRELGGNFKLSKFKYHAKYNADEGRVNMGQISLCRQTVHIEALDLTVAFDKNEFMRTESSMKYSRDDIRQLASQCGLRIYRQWINLDKGYTLNLFAPR